MTLRERLTRQRKSRSLSSYATTSNKGKASKKDNLNVYKSFRIEASLEAYPTPKGRNLCVVIKLETIPETTTLEITQSSKSRSLEPVKNATEDMSKDNEDSFQDLSWILQFPGLFLSDKEETVDPSPLRFDEPASTAAPYTSAEQSNTNPSIDKDLSYREKLFTPALPFPFDDYDLKTTSYPTVSKPTLRRTSRIHLSQENLVQPSPSIKSEAFLPKDVEKPKIEVSKIFLFQLSQANFISSSFINNNN
jgi:hypothetical protein